MSNLSMSRGAATSEDIGLRRYFTNVLLTMAFGLAATGAVSWWISHDLTTMRQLFHLVPGFNSKGKAIMQPVMSMWWLVAAGVELLVVLALSVFKNGIRGASSVVSLLLFAIFAVANGVTLAPVLYAYTDASVAKVFFVAAAMFAGCAIWGKTTTVNLRGLGSFFMLGLLGVLAALVASMFFHSTMMDFVINIVGVLLFAGLTAYDMQRLEDYYDEDHSAGGPVVYGALVLYLDFINLFLYLLRLFGERK